MSTAHSVSIDITPITTRSPDAPELRVGDIVRLQFDDWIEGLHSVTGEVVELFQHGRVAVKSGPMKFNAPADCCTLIKRASDRDVTARLNALIEEGRAVLTPKLTSHEWEVLECLAGKRKLQWGAWVGACCEHLKGLGYASGLYEITAEGLAALANRKGGA